MKIDVSEQLLFQRYRQGVKLVKPKPNQTSQSVLVADILAMPINVYFSNRHGISEKCNDLCAISCGYDSTKQSIGHSIYDIPEIKRECAESILRNNLAVIESNRISVIEEDFARCDESGFHALTIKLPWYDSENNTLGIFGCSIVIGQQSLANTLSKLMAFGLFIPALDFPQYHSPLMGKYIGDIYYSKREVECILWYVRGKSARNIGNILGISQRTVEQYLASIKRKMNVKTKSELMDIIMQYCI